MVSEWVLYIWYMEIATCVGVWCGGRRSSSSVVGGACDALRKLSRRHFTVPHHHLSYGTIVPEHRYLYGTIPS